MSDLKKNWLEWSVFAVSLVLVAGAMGYLVYDAVHVGDAPALLEVRLGKPQQQRKMKHWVVPVTVENQGDESVQGVVLEIVMQRDGRNVETVELQMDYVPRQSQREGRAVFTTDPRHGTLEARVLGYANP